MAITLFKDSNQTFQLFQTKLKSELDPVLANPLLQGNLITFTLVNGENQINHKLARQQVGWIVTDINVPTAFVYRSKAFNDKILYLTSSVNCTIGIWCF